MLSVRAGGREIEFWEGAILVVGGIWLVGKMARSSSSHPLNKTTSTISAVGTVSSQGNTIATNTDGSTSLIAGEPLSTPSAPITVNKVVTTNPVTAAPVRSPIVSSSTLQKNTAVKVPVSNIAKPTSSFSRLGRSIDL